MTMFDGMLTLTTYGKSLENWETGRLAKFIRWVHHYHYGLNIGLRYPLANHDLMMCHTECNVTGNLCSLKCVEVHVLDKQPMGTKPLWHYACYYNITHWYTTLQIRDLKQNRSSPHLLTTNIMYSCFVCHCHTLKWLDTVHCQEAISRNVSVGLNMNRMEKVGYLIIFAIFWTPVQYSELTLQGNKTSSLLVTSN